MNVSGKDRRETARDRSTRNHVRMTAKDIAGGANRCALERLMKTEQAHDGSHGSPSGALDERGELSLDLVPLAGETRDGHIDAAKMQGNRSRAVEDMDAWMHGQERIGDRGALVVPGNDDDGHAGVGDTLEGLERAHHDARFDSTPKEHVPTVNDEIRVACERRLQRPFETGEEVVAPPRPVDARMFGPLQPEMRIGEKQDADDAVRHAKSVVRETLAE